MWLGAKLSSLVPLTGHNAGSVTASEDKQLRVPSQRTGAETVTDSEDKQLRVPSQRTGAETVTDSETYQQGSTFCALWV